MKYKSKVQQDINDWKFIFNAMCNGDNKALKAFTRCREINNEIEQAKIEGRQHNVSAFRLVFIERIRLLEKEKQSLLFEYQLTKKKAKIYIETLRREQKEKML